MISFKLDMRDFQKGALDVGGDLKQVPFALARSMNDAAQKARSRLIDDTWPSSIQQRNKSFIAASLTTKGQAATKKNLTVVLYDKLGRGNLEKHADGGVRTPRRGHLAVPSSKIKRGARGVAKGLRPRALPNSFVKGDIIYQRTGSYVKSGSHKSPGQDNRRIILMYTLKSQTAIKKDVPFREAFEETFTTEIGKAFAIRFDQAMRSRR